MHRALPPSLNPLAQTGAIACTTLMIAVVSGVAVLIWYRVSVHDAWSSLDGLGRAPALGALTRSVHRYSSDACMLFSLLHAARTLAARRFGGPRWLAWVTGVASVWLLWLVGWLGYWLVWDQRAQQVAAGTARMLDLVPIFGDPPSRSFLTDAGVSSMLFFVVFFAHMLIPLGIGVGLWLHLTRVSRARVFTDRTMTALVVVTLCLVSLAWPATSAPMAQMARVPGAMHLDAWYLLPLYLTDRLAGSALWALTLGLTALVTAVPWALRRGCAPIAEVDTRRCNACRRCSEDCPFEAIKMVPRTDGRGYSVVAEVDAGRCVGCGICAGSCEPSAIGVPWLDPVTERHRLDRWLDAAKAGGEHSWVGFVCGESAAGALRGCDDEGRSPKLPGWRLLAVPCVGQVSTLTVERCLRHGAEGVMLAACGEGDCGYREGALWTALRMAGAREPALRDGRVDRSRVRLVHHHRVDLDGLVRAAKEMEAGAAERSRDERRRRVPMALRALAGAGLAAGVAWATLAGAGVRYRGPPAESGSLVVSFRHPGRNDEACRRVSADELARTPVHMRRETVCERGRAPVRLRLRVDGSPARELTLAPRGLHGDEASIALVRMPLTDGPHRVTAEIGDSRDPREWQWRTAGEVTARPGERRVLLFDRSAGFTWH